MSGLKKLLLQPLTREFSVAPIIMAKKTVGRRSRKRLIRSEWNPSGARPLPQAVLPGAVVKFWAGYLI